MILSAGLQHPLFDASNAGWAVATLVASIAYVVTLTRSSSHTQERALVAAWLAHGVAIVVHLFGIGQAQAGARFGFAPALSATAWLVLLVYLVESRLVPLSGVRRWLSVIGLVTVLLASVFPGEVGYVHPTSPWAPLHWVLGIASYGLFGAAVLHATMLDRSDRALRGAGAALREPSAGVPLLKLERLTFQFVSLGFGVLSAAIVLGWWFSNPWRWDHKTVFSLLAWVVFAALLAGRASLGWRGRRATRWLYVGAGFLFLAYVGSRFVLEVLLHRAPSSY